MTAQAACRKMVRNQYAFSEKYVQIYISISQDLRDKKLEKNKQSTESTDLLSGVQKWNITSRETVPFRIDS